MEEEPPGSLDGSDGVKGRECHEQLAASGLDGGIRGAPACTEKPVENAGEGHGVNSRPL